MGVLENFRRRKDADWCRKCKRQMDRADRRLFAIPKLNVGHYVEYEGPEFYQDTLHPVGSRSDIPAGMYACRAVLYRCPACGSTTTVLEPFLPVRELEKRERDIVFRNGELDDMFWHTFS